MARSGAPRSISTSAFEASGDRILRGCFASQAVQTWLGAPSALLRFGGVFTSEGERPGFTTCGRRGDFLVDFVGDDAFGANRDVGLAYFEVDKIKALQESSSWALDGELGVPRTCWMDPYFVEFDPTLATTAMGAEVAPDLRKV